MNEELTYLPKIDLAEVVEGRTSFQIATKDWVQEYVQDPAISYSAIFSSLCRNNRDKEEEYRTLLKMYNNNYRTVVILIEYDNLKKETKLLNGALEEC